jgi:hypothetical protein
MPSESDLAMATRHVATGKQIIAKHRALIVKLKAAGASTLDAEYTLDVFLSTLRIFEDHERQLREELHQPSAP